MARQKNTKHVRKSAATTRSGTKPSTSSRTNVVKPASKEPTTSTTEKVKATKTQRFLHPSTIKDSVFNKIRWEHVRVLEFTSTQDRYASDQNNAEDSTERTVHDIAMMCPNLEILTLSIPGATFMKPTTKKNPIQRRSTPEIDRVTHFFRIFEHSNLQRLNIDCADAGRYTSILHHSSVEIVAAFGKGFQKEAKKRGRQIELKIDVEPWAKGTKRDRPKFDVTDGECIDRYYDFIV